MTTPLLWKAIVSQYIYMRDKRRMKSKLITTLLIYQQKGMYTYRVKSVILFIVQIFYFSMSCILVGIGVS